MKAEDVQGTTKKLFRLKHCFDYYKDISETGTILNGSYHQYKNYIESDNLYFIITKEMYWNFLIKDYNQWNLFTQNAAYSGIAYWTNVTDKVPYYLSDEGQGIFMPIWYTNPYNYLSNYPKSLYYDERNTDINNTKYFPYNIIALGVDGKNSNRTDYAVNLWTEKGNSKNYLIGSGEGLIIDYDKHALGLKYPSSSDYEKRTYSSAIKAYVTYENITPYIISRNTLLNNANYYIGSYHVYDYNYLGWGRTDECNVYILPTLMHEYCEPTICPYAYIYNGYNGKYIGNISIKYKIKSSSINNYYNKNIPIYFTAYKCEAYTNK